MTPLNTDPNLAGHDDLYAALIRLHEGLTDAQSLKVWSRLVLLLANHIGDRNVLAQAIALARPDAASSRAPSSQT